MFLCIWNIMNFDFETLMDNIFSLSQLLILDNSKFILLLKFVTELLDISNVVVIVLSSAKRIALKKLLALEISFM